MGLFKGLWHRYIYFLINKGKKSKPILIEISKSIRKINSQRVKDQIKSRQFTNNWRFQRKN